MWGESIRPAGSRVATDRSWRRSACLPVLMIAACGLMVSPRARAGEVEELKRRLVEWQQRATVAEVERARLEREIARLEAELEKASECPPPEETTFEVESTPPSAIGLDQKIEETDLEETDLEETDLEETDLEETDLEETDLEETPVSGETSDAPAGSPAADLPIAAEGAPPVAGLATPSAQAQALYDEGYTLFHQQQYADAEARFSRYVELHPRTDLADNALFWTGESRFARGDFSSALEAFSATVERYPQGNKVSDALLKAGKCLESLGDIEHAQKTYEEVVRRYPGSAAAAQARDRLEGLH